VTYYVVKTVLLRGVVRHYNTLCQQHLRAILSIIVVNQQMLDYK